MSFSRIYGQGFVKAQSVQLDINTVVTFDMSNRLSGFLRPNMSQAGTGTIILPTTKVIEGAFVRISLRTTAPSGHSNATVRNGSIGGTVLFGLSVSAIISPSPVYYDLADWNFLFDGSKWIEFGP